MNKSRFLMILMLLGLGAWFAATRGEQAARASAALETQETAAADEFLTLEPTWISDGTDKGAEYGKVVIAAGDVNCDSIPDAAIGTPKFLVELENSGAVFVYAGVDGYGLGNDVYRFLTTQDKGSLFGEAVASAGDVDGNGCDDLIVGAPNHFEDGMFGQPGAAYLYYSYPSPTGLLDTPGWSKAGPEKDSHLGAAVAAAGDVNGDGYADVLVSAPAYCSTLILSEGLVWLFHGSAAGLESEPAWTFTGEQYAAKAGTALAGLGDVNGDGLDDFAVSAPYFNTSVGLDAGKVWVFFGSRTNDTGVEAASWSVLGTQVNEYLGSALAGAGDVNGDGFADLVIGAVGFNEYMMPGSGAAFLYLGSSSGMRSASPWRVTGRQAYSGFGYAVGALGDVNGDQLNDIVVGAYLYDEGGSPNDKGMVSVYAGTKSGLTLSPVWTMLGDKADSTFGKATAGVGDVDQDGYADLIVGAPEYKLDDKTPLGRVFVYHGEYAEVSFPNVFLPFILKSSE